MKNKPSLGRIFERSLRLSFQNIWRNKVLSLATIFVIGILIFIFNIVFTVNLIAQDSLQNLSQKIDIVVYIKESTSFSEIQRLKTDISNLEGVHSVTYTNKEDALNEIKQTHPDLSLAFEKYNLGNPLPASLEITTIHPSYHQDINNFLNQNRNKKYLSNIVTNDSSNNAIISSVSQNLLKVTNFTEQLMLWLTITFIFGGTLIMLNALQITIYSRKQEITIMKLVGASPGTIHLPFILESIIYAIFAVTISFLMIFILSKNLQLQNLDLVIFFMELGITILIGITSSTIAVHEHLQQAEL